MEMIFQHSGTAMVMLAWIVCGTVSVVRRQTDVLVLPFILTALWGVYHCFK